MRIRVVLFALTILALAGCTVVPGYSPSPYDYPPGYYYRSGPYYSSPYYYAPGPYYYHRHYWHQFP